MKALPLSLPPSSSTLAVPFQSSQWSPQVYLAAGSRSEALCDNAGYRIERSEITVGTPCVLSPVLIALTMRQQDQAIGLLRGSRASWAPCNAIHRVTNFARRLPDNGYGYDVQRDENIRTRCRSNKSSARQCRFPRNENYLRSYLRDVSLHPR